MAMILKLLFRGLLPFLSQFGWILGLLVINRFGRRLWRWFWA